MNRRDETADSLALQLLERGNTSRKHRACFLRTALNPNNSADIRSEAMEDAVQTCDEETRVRNQIFRLLTEAGLAEAFLEARRSNNPARYRKLMDQLSDSLLIEDILRNGPPPPAGEDSDEPLAMSEVLKAREDS